MVLVFHSTNWNTYSQTTIRGTVYHTDEKTPVPSASVYIHGTTRHTMTDSEGRFSLENTKPPFQLIVNSLGYTPYTITIDTDTDRKVNLR